MYSISRVIISSHSKVQGRFAFPSLFLGLHWRCSARRLPFWLIVVCKASFGAQFIGFVYIHFSGLYPEVIFGVFIFKLNLYSSSQSCICASVIKASSKQANVTPFCKESCIHHWSHHKIGLSDKAKWHASTGIPFTKGIFLSSCALLKLVHTLGNRKSCSATKQDQTATDIRGMKNHTEFSTANKIDQLHRMRKWHNFADLHFICSLRRLRQWAW